MRETLEKLRPDHWAWLHAKVAFIIWATLILIYTPVRVADVLGFVLVIAMCSVIILGMLISIFGLFGSLSNKASVARQGVRLELFGLWLSMGGPFAYMATQIYILTQPNPGDRSAQVVLAYLIMAFLLIRIVIILSHRKRAQG